MKLRTGLWALFIASAVIACGGGSSSGSPGNRPPTASFTMSPSSGAAPLNVQFDAASSADPDGSITSYAWEFGDGQQASGASATTSHEYANDGVYTVRLTVTDNGGAQGSTTRSLTVSQPQSGQWLGAYESSLLPESFLYADLTIAGNSVTGTYEDEYGRLGTISGSVNGQDVTLAIVETTPGCSGSFTGSGALDPLAVPDTQTVTFDFTGTNCDGSHSGGTGALVLQRSEVLAWAQYDPSGLTQRNGSLYWSDSSFDPLKKLDTSTGTVTVLAPFMRSVTALAVGGSRIVWVDNYSDLGEFCTGQGSRSALAVANADGSGRMLLADADTCGIQGHAARIASDGTFAYWAHSTQADPYVIERVPLAGGDPAILARPGNVDFKGWAVDATHLYWAEAEPAAGSKILRCPLAGCGAQPPTVVVQTDDAIQIWSNPALTGNSVVVGISRSGLGYRIASVPKTGGTFTDIASASDQVLRVLADASSVYWLSGDALHAVALGGGAVTTLVADFFYVQDIALGSGRVYFADASFNGGFPDAVYYVDKTGGPVTKLADATSPMLLEVDSSGNVVYADGGRPTDPVGIHRVTPAGVSSPVLVGVPGSTDLAVDDQFVYAPAGFNINRVSPGGGNAALVARTGFYPLAPVADGGFVYWLENPQNLALRAPGNQTSQPELIGVGSGSAADLAVRNGYVYWLGQPGSLFRAPVTGGATEVMASNLRFATNLVVDDQFVYVIEADADSLTKIAITGGQRTQIADTDLYFGWFAMTMDQNNVYWVSPDGVFRAAKAGGGRVTYDRAVLQDQFTPAAIAVDSQYLYWTESTIGAVKRRPK